MGAQRVRRSGCDSTAIPAWKKQTLECAGIEPGLPVDVCHGLRWRRRGWGRRRPGSNSHAGDGDQWKGHVGQCVQLQRDGQRRISNRTGAIARRRNRSGHCGSEWRNGFAPDVGAAGGDPFHQCALPGGCGDTPVLERNPECYGNWNNNHIYHHESDCDAAGCSDYVDHQLGHGGQHCVKGFFFTLTTQRAVTI